MKDKKIKVKSTEEKEKKPLLLDITVSKECPLDHVPLAGALLFNVEVDYCPVCLGLWFEDQELRLAKDNKDKDLQWCDIDLWKDKKKFRIGRGARSCPLDRVPLYEVFYGKSPVVVDVCSLCRGVWLDRGEFKKIIKWVRESADYEVLHKYAKDLFEEAAEVFIGPETLREEILDFIAVLKLLKYKFAVRHPEITKTISHLPK